MEERKKLIEDQKRQAALLEAELKINQVITDYIIETESTPDQSTNLYSIEDVKEAISIATYEKSEYNKKELSATANSTPQSEEMQTVVDYLKKAEEVGKKLDVILAATALDIGGLRNCLRSLGSLSRGAFEMIGSALSPTQVTLITENTQGMLRIGLELKNNPIVDSPEKRKELRTASFMLITLMKEVSSIRN